MTDTADLTPQALPPLEQTRRITTADVSRLLIGHTPSARAALRYLEGDMWQDGKGWVGPRLIPEVDGGDEARAFSAEVERILTGANIVREFVLRHVAGVLGREPSWALIGVSEADQALLTTWWDSEVVPSSSDKLPTAANGVLGDALARALCGEITVLRLRVQSRPNEPRDLADALSRIKVDVMGADEAAVLSLDPVPLGVAALYRDSHSLAYRLGVSKGLQIVEATTLDDSGNTIVFVANVPSSPLPLGGRLTMAALSVPPLITPTIIGMQRHLVKTMTAMGRNTDYAGFAEITYLNAQRPTTPIEDDTQPSGYRYEPRPLKTGPGVRTWLTGIEQSGTAGGVINATPSVFVRDPVSPAAFTETSAELTFRAYCEARQLHALIGNQTEMSGESRRQAAADFIASLGGSAQGVQSVAAWMLETVYALALALIGDQIADGVKATVTCNLSGTLATGDELREKRDAVSAGLIDRSHYQMAQGIADPIAEDALIQASRARLGDDDVNNDPDEEVSDGQGDDPDDPDDDSEQGATDRDPASFD